MKFETIDYTKELPEFGRPIEQYGISKIETRNVFAFVTLKGSRFPFKMLIMFEWCTQYGKTTLYVREVRCSRQGTHIRDYDIWGYHNIPKENIVDIQWLKQS
jgi:hypothetical protein